MPATKYNISSLFPLRDTAGNLLDIFLPLRTNLFSKYSFYVNFISNSQLNVGDDFVLNHLIIGIEEKGAEESSSTRWRTTQCGVNQIGESRNLN